MVEAGAYDASNFNQLLSYLGSMTPQQRAQVGQMHQNDFEVITALSLINSAEARAKQARATQQAMGQPAAPPVNQQVIAETAQNALPEEVGIGALPERSLTDMANGGIVGYGDGGMMMGDGYNMAVGYEPNRTPAMSYAGGGAVESYAPGGNTAAAQAFNKEFSEFLRKAFNMSVAEYRTATPEAKARMKEMFTSQRGAPLTAFEIGQKAAPYVEKAKTVGKAVAGPLLGGAATAAYGLGEVERAKGFYEDPNVPTAEKILQFARTGAKTALPVVGGAVGSGFSPFIGTAAGAGAGMGISSLIDPEGQALQEWRKANPPAADKETALGLDNFRQQLIDAQQMGQITKTEAEAMFADAVKRGTKNPTFTYREPTGGEGAPGAAPTAGAGPAAGAGAAPVASAAKPMSVEELIAARDTIKSRLSAEHPAAKQLEELGQMMTKGAQEDVAAVEERAKRTAERYKGREARYAEQEAKLAKDADSNTGLALLTAAAAVLQPGGLAAGLMNAANKAIPQYREGLEKLKAAQDKINLGREHLEDLRYASEDMTDRERRQAQTLARQAGIDAKKLMIQGIMDTQGVRDKEANSIFDNYVKQHIELMQQTGATERTGMSTAALAGRTESAEEMRLAALAETTRKNIAAEAEKQYKYDPVMRQQYVQTALRQAIQQNPSLAKYMGVTGGGAATSQSDPLGILGKP